MSSYNVKYKLQKKKKRLIDESFFRTEYCQIKGHRKKKKNEKRKNKIFRQFGFFFLFCSFCFFTKKKRFSLESRRKWIGGNGGEKGTASLSADKFARKEKSSLRLAQFRQVPPRSLSDKLHYALQIPQSNLPSEFFAHKDSNN